MQWIVQSGTLRIGPMEGAFALWRHSLTSDSGWGTSFMWEYEGVVTSGNAIFDVHARVVVSASRSEHDGVANARFQTLVAEAEAIIGGLSVHLE